MAAGSGILDAEGLRKSYDGHEVVAGVSFSLRPGECYGLLGPNDAARGATTPIPP